MGNRKRRKRRSRAKGAAKRGAGKGASGAPVQEPILFDLPLHPENAEPSAEPSVEAGSGSEPAVGQGPSILFDEAESRPSLLPLKSEPPQSKPAERPKPKQVELLETGVEDLPLAARGSEDVASTPPGARGDETAFPENKAFLGDRLLAGLADLAAQLIAMGLAIAATHSIGVVVTPADWMPFAVLAAVFSFLYWIVPLAFWGQTPGMAWVGHIARSSGGEPLSFGQTFLRWFGAVLTLAFVGLPMLAALTGRSLTDRISGSHTIAPP